MKVDVENDWLLVKRLENKKTGQFIEAGADNKSPFFEVVSSEDQSHYLEGEIVVPHPQKLIPIELDNELFYFVEEQDILATASKKEAKHGRS